jgi:hypothetical protein
MIETTSKPFTGIELQHEAAQRICEEIKDMTPEEELAYWDKQTQALLKWQQELREQQANPDQRLSC